MAAKSFAQAGDTRLLVGRYRLDRELGRGGMGVVFRGADLLMQRPVAVKLLHAPARAGSSLVQRFLHEVRNVARLQHEHVIQVFDVGQSELGEPFFVMELVTGISLSDLLRSEGRLPVARAVGLALVQQPDRFGAYFIDVGLTNVLRMGETSLGPASGEEYGALGSEAGFRALLAADVYTQVAQGASHPPVLLTAGMRDARIPAWEPAKMAARLQALTRGRTLLRVDAEGGHFSERRADGNAQLADVYAFLLDALGKPAPAQ